MAKEKATDQITEQPKGIVLINLELYKKTIVFKKEFPFEVAVDSVIDGYGKVFKIENGAGKIDTTIKNKSIAQMLSDGWAELK